MFYTNVAFTWWQRHLKRNGLLHWYHRLSLQIQWNHVSKVWKQNWDQWKLTFYLNAWYQWTYKLKNHLIPSFHQCALRHQTYLLQRTFHHWHQQGTYLTNTLLIFSSHVYQRSLLRSHLKQWSQQYLLGVAMQPTLHALQTYYLTHLLQRVWKAWHSLPAWTDPADKCYLHAWFRRWHHAWSSRTTFLPPFTLRRQHQCFHGWYARTLAIRQARLQGQLVYHFRSLHLQSWTFQGWLHQVHQSQRYWTWVQWAEKHHYQRHLKHRVFKVWVHTTQDQLRNHFRLALHVTKKNTDRLLTFWKTWWTYCLSQRLKRKSFQCALLHFHRHVLQKTFHDWFQWTLWHQWMQSTQFKADHFYGQQRLQWGWSIWKHRAHFKKTIHQRTQVASCWYLRQLVRRGWTVWILKLRLHLNLLRFYHHLHQRQIHEWFLHSWNVWRYRWQQNIKSYQIWYHQFMKWSWIAGNIIQVAFSLAFDMQRLPFLPFSQFKQIGIFFFQAFSNRTSGFYIVNLNLYSKVVQVIWVFIMLMDSYPLLLTIKYTGSSSEKKQNLPETSSPKEEKSLDLEVSTVAQGPKLYLGNIDDQILATSHPLTPSTIQKENELALTKPVELHDSTTNSIPLSSMEALKDIVESTDVLASASPTTPSQFVSQSNDDNDHLLKQWVLRDVSCIYLCMLMILIAETPWSEAGAPTDGLKIDLWVVLFEVTSTYSTVGLSLDQLANSSIASTFSSFSKFVMIITMLLGRTRSVPSTIDYSFAPPEEPAPKEQVFILSTTRDDEEEDFLSEEEEEEEEEDDDDENENENENEDTEKEVRKEEEKKENEVDDEVPKVSDGENLSIKKI
ncbi:hypothetical protein HMI56_005829 [Coelomomyces lativittatus]|nr:hypothetical protein HMI56_005829 [Coelomomyces lativittatus]